MKSTFTYSVLIVILLTIGRAGYGQAAEREMVAGIAVNYDESYRAAIPFPIPLYSPTVKK